ncbi:MAG: pantoate--beta-alanine ligase [Alphaproteobacteria bacterium]|nr:pantoate--beta-alanine ligase [Alphaproteobacteria bacterium]MBV9062038.1 pantoate--beta-alanine ligase [Alphaproteobacteria bacterium]
MIEGPGIVSTVAALRVRLAAVRQEGVRMGLVPTMGALHEGHLSLVRETRARCGLTVVSIFVNPAQFGPNEDFARYPRTFESDCAKLAGLADVVFAPSVPEMYPEGFATRIEVGGPAQGLESDFRPHFFSGVATVVAKLLIAVMPDEATFGEKDYQQLLVIRRLVADLGLPIEIVAGETVREPDGLAMSSRNAYLSPEERKIASHLNVVLRYVAKKVYDGEPIAAAEADGREALFRAGFASVDYVAIRDAGTLAIIDALEQRSRVLAAGRVGTTRLIDNLAV